MNLILLTESDLVGAVPGAAEAAAGRPPARARLAGRRARHVRKVLRAEVGDVLTVGLRGGAVGTGRVVALARDDVELAVTLDATPPAPLDVVLVLALPRPPVLRRTLAQVTSLGVKRIALVDAERVERSFWQSRALEPEAIDAQLDLGLEQARDTVPPTVTLHRRLADFVANDLPPLAAGRACWLADPIGGPLPSARLEVPSLVAVGPEGGWVQRELDRLAHCGLRPLSLGRRALRVETAVPVILGRFL